MKTCDSLVGRMKDLCLGYGTDGRDDPPLAEVLAWRKRFEKIGVEVPKMTVPQKIRIQHAKPKELVGNFLKDRIQGLLGIKSGKGCACKDLAEKMNSWGIDGCQKNRNEIINTLVKNKEILKISLSKSAFVFTMQAGLEESFNLAKKIAGEWWNGKDVSEQAFTEGANWLLDRAIEDTQIALEKSKKISRGRKRSGVFAYNNEEKVRFITSSQLQQDIKILLGKIPSDITAIAGVARSGLSVATMLAMYLHLPMITIRQTLNDIVDTGNGWRLGGSSHINPKNEKILIVDDTVMTGNSIKAITPLAKREFKNYLFAAVYVNPKASFKPDIYAVDLPWPHILEWNVFNSVLSSSFALDFDGILCYDCPVGSDDDGKKYLDFINNAQPLYTPRKTAIPLIVTARIEKYREPTLKWLERHNIKVTQLIMHPAKTLRERKKDNIPAYKAAHFINWLNVYNARIQPQIFFESEDWQAKEMGKIVAGRGLVICPSTGGVY